jgi:LAO/AO transport system kinase
MTQKKDNRGSALKVNKGIEAPSSINPYLQGRLKTPLKEISVQEYAEGIKEGNITLLSKAITMTESQLASHQKKADEIMEACLSASGNSIRIGITGIPGVGKSTFIESFGLHLIERGHKLAVLAIDPSSQKSGGSILGDKTRMEELSGNTNVFIRPTASTGVLGGVAKKTKESILLCEAAGFDVIIVETVGVGQSEVLVKNMVDFFLLLLLPGAGDELQGIKRGIMEVADGIVINKSDGENEAKASLAQSQIISALQLFPLNPNEWNPQVLKASSLYNKGIPELWTMIKDYEKQMKRSGYFLNNRMQQEQFSFHETLNNRIINNFYQNERVKDLISKMKEEIKSGKMSSFAAADEVLKIGLNF